MKLGHVGEKALQGLAKQGLLDGATIDKFGFCEHCILGKQTRVKFGTAIHNMKGLWIMFTRMFGDLQRFHHWEVNIILLPLLMIFPRKFGCIA